MVYDLDNKEISMAQTNFDATGSNIQAIQAGSQGVPEVSGTVTGVSVAQTGTAQISRGYGVVGTATVSGTAASTTASTTAAAAALQMPTTNPTGVVILAMGSMLALLGSCFIFL